MKIPGVPSGVLLALGGVKSWQVDGTVLRLVLDNAFLEDGLEKNKDWMVAHLKNWIADLSDISLAVESKEEAALENWDSQKAVWLEVFKGRVK